MHLFTQLGDEVQAVSHQQVLGQRLGKITFVAKEFAHEAFRQLGNRMSIIDIAGRQAKGYQLALVIDNQVELEAVKPANRGFATSGSSGKDAVLVDAGVVTDGKGSGVDETDAGAATQVCVQVGDQWHKNRGHQLHEAVIAHQSWELTLQVALHILGVIGFEGSRVGLMEQDNNRHDLTWMQLSRAQALALP